MGLYDAVRREEKPRRRWHPMWVVALAFAAALVTALRTRLPKYMLPNRLRQVAQMPYNANGKIDRVALKERYLHAEG